MKRFLVQFTVLLFFASSAWGSASDWQADMPLNLLSDVLKNLFTVNRQKIVISGTNRMADSQVMEVLDGSRASSAKRDADYFYFWELASESVKDMLLRDPWILSVKTRWRIFPLVAEFVIEEQRPYAVAEFYNESWLVSKDGEMIEPLSSTINSQVVVEASTLPRLIGIDELKDKSTTYAGAGNRLEYSLSFFKMLQQQRAHIPFSIESITLLDDGAFLVTPVELKKYPKVIFPFDKQFNFLTASKKIDAIVNDSQSKKQRLNKLDFRHNYVIAQ